MNPAFIRSLILKVLAEEGLLPRVIVMGPDCQPRVFSDAE